MAKYKQGTYKVKNKSKYVGQGDPRYLSSWEYDCFEFFDMHPDVIQWGAENVIVPYYSTADGRNRRYMVDLFVKYKDEKGQVIKELVEIKPFCQTQPPKKTRRKKQSTYLKESYTFQVNIDKWKAASLYAKKRKMRFRIITEKNIFR